MLKPGKLNVNQVILAINIGAVPTGAKHRQASKSIECSDEIASDFYDTEKPGHKCFISCKKRFVNLRVVNEIFGMNIKPH